MAVRDIIVLGFFAASLPFCFFRPFYGVALWVVIAFLNPHRFAYAAQNYPLALAVAIPTMIGFLAFAGDWKGLRSRECGLVIGLGVWFTITSFAAAHNPVFVHHIADTWDRWNFVSKVLLMTVVTMAVVNSFYRLRILLLVIAGCFGVLIVKAVPFIIMTGGAFRLFGPEQSMIADNNDLGLALNMTLPIFFFLAKIETRPWLKRLFAFLFIATIPAVFCTYSRGALVGLVVVSGLMLLQLKERFLLIPVLILGLGIVALFAPESWKERMNPTREGAVDGSARGRLNAWAYARALAYDYPIAGGGFATFTPQLYSRYAPPGSVIIGSHSVYFGLLAEHGFAGLGLYLFLVLCCFGSLRGLTKGARTYDDEEVLLYANMLKFSLIAFLISGIFLARAYFDYYFMIVACIVILKRVATERWEQQEADAEAEEGTEDVEEVEEPSGWRLHHAG